VLWSGEVWRSRLISVAIYSDSSKRLSVIPVPDSSLRSTFALTDSYCRMLMTQAKSFSYQVTIFMVQCDTVLRKFTLAAQNTSAGPLVDGPWLGTTVCCQWQCVDPCFESADILWGVKRGILIRSLYNPWRYSSDEPWPAEQPPLVVFPDCTRRYWVNMWSANRIPPLHFQLSKPDRYFFIQVTTQFIRSRGWVDPVPDPTRWGSLPDSAYNL
jgi:hypothetical protein